MGGANIRFNLPTAQAAFHVTADSSAQVLPDGCVHTGGPDTQLVLDAGSSLQVGSKTL